MKKSPLVLSVLTALSIVGCSEAKPEFSVNQINVSDYAYTMNEQPAVSVTIIHDDYNYCSITFLRSNVEQGFSAFLEQKSTGQLSSICNVNGNNFVQSSKHPTKAILSIDKLDELNQIATIKTSLKLVNNKTYDDYFELNEIELNITGEQFTNLTTVPSK